ncbi:hypothetical protein BCR43DRAFT_448131 [Syncephalastrum racemosum]|uniref:Inhibitor I9 domain-containing protein n=1 Tax=Syncephalastrum racemosum TaxID=13706 RepID=A0A1X2GZL5_SYNRA|nr:hypothetical protein BCR43DRAFT_448131 [Syncephalastrum racemosum]
MPSKYFITFKNGTPANAVDDSIKQAEASGAKIKDTYDSARRRYSIEVSDENPFIFMCTSDPNVSAVQPELESNTDADVDTQ